MVLGREFLVIITLLESIRRLLIALFKSKLHDGLFRGDDEPLFHACVHVLPCGLICVNAHAFLCANVKPFLFNGDANVHAFPFHFSANALPKGLH